MNTMDILDPSVTGFMWALAIALTVIVLDVFFETEVLSVLALLGISIYFALLFDVELKWRILVTLLCWVLVNGVFYLGWKRFAVPLLRRRFVGGVAETVHSAVGGEGVFRVIDGKHLIYWNGDLWPIAEGCDVSGLNDHDGVTITAHENGVFKIQSKNR
jgi:membrane protein implicated in regulation of membrane protease activity